MRVYYVSSGLQGCYTVRCLLPLMANGWDGDQTALSLDQRTPENKAKAADHADVIVFHRPDDPKKLELARLLKQAGKKIVFDNDDTFKDDGGFKMNEFMDEARMKVGVERVNKTIDQFIKEADLVTCSTDFLKEEYKELNPNVITLPNCVDPFYFDEPLKNESDVFRIGIVGSIAITSDMDGLKPIVEHFQGRKDVKLVLFSMPPKNNKIIHELYAEEYRFWENVDVEWQTFVDMQDYYETLNGLRLDMMIIPRADNYFNRCKSNLKFLEASMFEIPVLAQSFPDGQSPYERDPEDAKNMILVKDNWIQAIEDALKDKEGLKEMGKKAKQYVLEKYDIEKNADKWEKAYKTLYGHIYSDNK